MDLHRRTGGRFNLSQLDPVEYGWVASNLARELHRDPNYMPSDDDVPKLSRPDLPWLDLSEYPRQIHYTATILSYLIFHNDRLLVLLEYPEMGCSGRGVSVDDPRTCSIPQTHIPASYLGMNQPVRGTSIERVLTFNADEITGSRDRTSFHWPGVLYRTVPDDGSAYPYQTPVRTGRGELDELGIELRLGVVSGVFECAFEPGDHDPANPQRIQPWITVSQLQMPSVGPSRPLHAAWLTEKEVVAELWVLHAAKVLALAGFWIRRSEDVSLDGFEVGEMT